MPIIQKIQKVPLREIWKKEDKDFTKWLEENIDYLADVLGFEFSVISSEEAVGPFKVDLYGEDISGEKVIVENQLERTDHTHLGQVITYLVNLGAKTAIWIASDPNEEHAKAIDWLNEVTPDDISFYLVKLEAIKIGDDSSSAPLFTVIKRPTREKKQLGAEKKEYAERHVLREKFWGQFLEDINSKYPFCSNINPSTDNWIAVALGMSGVSANLVISKKYARVEIYINRGDKEENKKIFDYFYAIKDEIESGFGDNLIWERMEDNVTSRIKYQLDGVDVSDEADWPKMNKFLIDVVVRMMKSFKEPVRKLRSKI
ncbi:MAG: DUF4268 domain-containing protein [Patescibacteria group bacterium]|nr:DUF4268 domain-containing protein [Patescibacteria group bacterium]